ncbi:hypothetical protein HOE37_01705 [Candidatus Woesearchaeota archaeon]|jgi:hypothetical protein|nr:hypothetical protein [Candidatus Woesearchaeota archaeon]MBT4110549.1 hypothetical protein [Candidatus Woesearchaeota archaeon]MBT4335927.1 hypothetical protein [Candidatus Woesearchaeota archaeon]MBT4469094.1 hypothetical protein [Candidatus Woesearchaeota archaeon]MBT6744587.1 hypothetical protein [Candidatus Woesearchaeota archaeon]
MVNLSLEYLARRESQAVKASLTANQGTVGYTSLSLALSSAQEGDEAQTKVYLGQARDYCMAHKMIFPDQVAAEITTTAIVQDWRLGEEIRQRRLRSENVSSSTMKKGRPTPAIVH